MEVEMKIRGLMMDRGGVGKALYGRLQKMGVQTLVVEDGSIDTDALAAQVSAWQQAGPVQGVYWLTALDIEPSVEELDLVAWRELNRQRVKNLEPCRLKPRWNSNPGWLFDDGPCQHKFLKSGFINEIWQISNRRLKLWQTICIHKDQT